MSDPRSAQFERLTEALDVALPGKEVKYATHSFPDAGEPLPDLSGTAFVVTETVIASIEAGQHLEVHVAPLSAIRTITLSSAPGSSFTTNDEWNGRSVTIAVDGMPHPIRFPAGPTSADNAARFAKLYPVLITALGAA
ncbi:hypothetical protein [Clavibacter nebraskensis]|uniref:Uncharacterized protein n=1 Tax=Clavibacter nebraskensis TaxID=31963 RepID=A0A399QIC8_9MICO|nr:hypothetical protein [Clavibacter nebraskensis]KXU21833.1 hypothetical protein VV38_00380 [Clavibacter nebraskensis]OAH18912.1 hypothetical protein A3Q38_10860 [Clavibacter nebraskensis]QGV65511.1 hypothetical protein EGX36_00700 [Clavibacter nebraskensis]QGV68309.1 hypothetical protein EGX37_00700 [Clavibacter nebraskensis]QGV71102.1 hypothetical protein EGX35_00700 [Clavibacter nebraskensis]